MIAPSLFLCSRGAIADARHDSAHLAMIAEINGHPTAHRQWLRVVAACDARLRPSRCDLPMGDGVRCELTHGHAGRCSDTARGAA